MKDPQIGALYAMALEEILFDSKSRMKPENALAQLASMEALIASSPELRGVLQSPAVPAQKKKDVMAKLAGEIGVAHLVQNFVLVLIDHKRIGHLGDVRESLEARIDERLGVIRADVVSAAPLDAARQHELESKLTAAARKQVRLNLTVDPELIGGATARLGSTLLDGSVRGRLDAIRRKLTREAADYKVRI